MQDNSDFRNKILKVNEHRKQTISGSYGVYDAYRWIRKNGWLNIGRPITTKQFYYIIREINKALSMSTQFDIDIPLPYEEKIEDMEKIIAEMLVSISKLPNVKNVEYRGVKEFADSAIMYKIRIYGTKVETNPQLKRDANRVIKFELDKNNISIPYTQIDVHQK